MVKHAFKFLFFLLFIIFVPYLMLEGASAALLATGVVKSPYPLLLEKFPAQFRLKPIEIAMLYSPKYQFSENLGHFYEVAFDPAIGFRNDALDVEWTGGSPDDAKNKFVILVFGGSTTYGDNWPRYLAEIAKEENVEQELLVLNAGHPGYMTFQQKIYFSSWILPKLEKQHIKPNLVMTMDGVNDVQFRVEGYTEYKKHGAPVWLSHYHGFQQKTDDDIRALSTLPGSAQNIVSRMVPVRNVTLLAWFPYTYAVVSQFKKKNELNKDSGNLDLKQDASGDYTKLKIPDDAEDEIIRAFRSCLLDFLGEVKIRGIDFVGYLQPILLKKYHPGSYEFKIPSVNIVFRDATYQALWLGTQRQMGGSYLVAVEGLFDKADHLYDDLMSEYPKNFGNLIYTFDKTDDPMYTDVSHYTQVGSKMIAHAMIKDLIQKGYLTQKKQPISS